jgi:hypothetical protein
VNPVITGIVIDQTRETGKWFVREVKDEAGSGVKPVFFRREKSDLIGRIYDKIVGAESAQRYAAAHLNELTEKTPVDVSNIVDDSGNLKLPPEKPEKITAEALQSLLDRKCNLVGSAQPNEGLQKIDDGVSLVTVISTTNKKELKREVDQLWSSYQGTEIISKDDFKRLMQLSIQLADGNVKSNDPKVWFDCKNFVGRLSSERGEAWKNQQVPEKFQFLKTFFHGEKTSETPASTTSAKTSAVADPLSGFRPEGTDLGPDQIFESKHWSLDALPPSNSDEIPWHTGDKMPRAHETRVRDAFLIHDALFEAVPQGQGLATVRADWVRDDLEVGNTADILKTLRSLRQLARSDEAKQTINALGKAVDKYAQHIKQKELTKNKAPEP